MGNEGPAVPTLRCPNCGNADLHFKPEGEIRCSRCRKKWTRRELVRTSGKAGSSYDYEVKEREED
jgi:ribosomal protein S27E